LTIFDALPRNRYRELKTSIIEKLKTLPGGIMGIHPSHFTNIAVHANQMPSKPHKDGLSNHNGLDGISSVGIFEDCYICFPHLGIRLKLHPLDICIVRGAALFHHMYKWKGKGRFVVVPFTDRHLFPTMRVKRPKHPGHFLGHQWKSFRADFPTHVLPTFE
jgi:hypothetical protein